MKTALLLMLPMVLSGLLHMVVVRLDLFAFIKIPINEGAFGANKTWRGMVMVPVLTVGAMAIAQGMEPAFGGDLAVSLRSYNPFILGGALGLVYVVAELPNSWLKRRLGILPGHLPEKRRALHVLADQADSVLGCGLVYLVMTEAPAGIVLLSVLLGPLVHLSTNVSLWCVGLRKQPL